ncbi:MAG: hypothetical protein HY744_06190 [Deltaproteobacteria bacterium]|nr:hypothetical protein [Deltaproteobacteria bacterium]
MPGRAALLSLLLLAVAAAAWLGGLCCLAGRDDALALALCAAGAMSLRALQRVVRAGEEGVP